MEPLTSRCVLCLLFGILHLVLISGCGTSKSTPNPSSSLGPSIKSDGTDLKGYVAKEVEFREVLGYFVAHSEVTFVVKPQKLLDRRITVTLSEADEDGLADLARQCKLEITRSDEKTWHIRDVEAIDGTEGLVGPTDH